MDYSLPGDLLLLLALIFNLLAGVAFWLTARGNRAYEGLALKSYNYFTLFTTLAFAYLYYLFFTHNFGIKYVYEYSDSLLPFKYLLSSFWGGQEGTYLLWLFYNALFGYLIIKKAGQYRNYAMMIFSAVNFFFLFIMMKLSPFAPLDFYAAEGAGLNPLLQDPWMVIHPPVIFVGYSMAAVPFAIALAALILKDFSGWVKAAFPWVAITALMLGAGNILGGYWAYKTLGWGGYWAWDPVENSSFIPWFASLALVHGMVLERRNGALRKTNILLTAFVFILVVYGTFLTRSGVLADFSVHSFVDLGINQFLIGFLVLYILMTAALFIPRIKAMGNTPLEYNFYSREFSLLAGMLLLFIFSMVVLFWTSLPFTTSFLSEEPRAADLSTYNGFAVPIAILYALFLTAAPFLSFQKFELPNWKAKLGIVAGASAVISFGLFHFMLDSSLILAFTLSLLLTGLVMYMMKPDLMKSLIWPLVSFVLVVAGCLIGGLSDLLFILYFGAAAMLTASNVVVFVGYLPDRWRLSGGHMAHFGFGLMLLGILGSSAYTTSKKLVLPRGESAEAFGLEISYLGMAHDIGVPKNELILTYDDGSGKSEARPQLYYSQRLDGIMRKPYVMKSVLHDLYFSPEQIQERQGQMGLVLANGETQAVGDYRFTFNGYEIGGQHEQSNPALTVVANVTVEYEGEVRRLEPMKVMQEDESGHSEFIDFPADFGENDEYSVYIENIIADKGAIVLKIPGLVETGPPDQLILDISKKPIINLVWLGTTFLLLGSVIVFIRRRSEAIPA